MTTTQLAGWLYGELAHTEGETAAARVADYALAYEIARRRLVKKGILRPPTDEEVNRILERM